MKIKATAEYFVLGEDGSKVDFKDEGYVIAFVNTNSGTKAIMVTNERKVLEIRLYDLEIDPKDI